MIGAARSEATLLSPSSWRLPARRARAPRALIRHIAFRDCLLRPIRDVHAQCGDAFLQRPPADPQHLGGQFAIAAHVFQGEFDVSLFEFPEWLARPKHYWTLIARRLPGIRAGAYTERRGSQVRQPRVYGPGLTPNAGEVRSVSRIKPAPAMMLARSRILRSSRTFPGQSYR